jgi:pyruvate dehydrogenase E2 component (dihydrolipoamide acetyltransferase)
MAREVILPKLGQTMEEGSIVEWFKQEGDEVKRGEILFTVESDKATLESESPARGYLRKILVPAGVTVPVLTPVAIIAGTLDEDISELQVAGSELAVARSEPSAQAEAPQLEDVKREGGRVFASPRARMCAREHGVDLALVTGTGPNGRVVERDVFAYVERMPKATPMARKVAVELGVDLATVRGTGIGGKITQEDVEAVAAPIAVPTPAPVPAPAALPVVAAEVPMSGVRAIIAQRMVAGNTVAAPVTLTIEADATQFVALREQLKARFAKELGFSVGYNDLLIKLVAHALRAFPALNAQLDEAAGVIRRLDAVHVALAVDTERGLLVPVVRDADRKGLKVAATELRAVVERARTGRATPDELGGSTFTITNLGMYEIDAFTPIINLPETAILGVGRIKERPAAVNGELCVRKMMWLSLTFDHRLVDGAPAARFLQYIKDLVEDPFLWLAATM